MYLEHHQGTVVIIIDTGAGRGCSSLIWSKSKFIARLPLRPQLKVNICASVFWVYFSRVTIGECFPEREKKAMLSLKEKVKFGLCSTTLWRRENNSLENAVWPSSGLYGSHTNSNESFINNGLWHLGQVSYSPGMGHGNGLTSPSAAQIAFLKCLVIAMQG